MMRSTGSGSATFCCSAQNCFKFAASAFHVALCRAFRARLGATILLCCLKTLLLSIWCELSSFRAARPRPPRGTRRPLVYRCVPSYIRARVLERWSGKRGVLPLNNRYRCKVDCHGIAMHLGPFSLISDEFEAKNPK